MLGKGFVVHTFLPVLISVPSHFRHCQRNQLWIEPCFTRKTWRMQCGNRTTLWNVSGIGPLLVQLRQRWIIDTHMHACTCTEIFIETCSFYKRPLEWVKAAVGWKTPKAQICPGSIRWATSECGDSCAPWPGWHMSLHKHLLKLAAAGSSCKSAQQLWQAYLSVSFTHLHEHNTTKISSAFYTDN